MSWYSRIIKKVEQPRLGYLRDLLDPNDVPLSIAPPVSGLPQSVDMRPAILRYFDQGQTSSCVANAWAGMIDICENIAHVEQDAISRLYLYYGARSIDGMQTQDGGTYLRSAAKALQRLGAPVEKYWQFDERKVNKQPQPDAYMHAHPRRDGVYERITGSGDIRLNKCRALLASGRPFVFGTSVTSSFLSLTGTWRFQRPAKNEQIAGGHAMCCVGYDEDGFIILNSWSRAWRDSGCARMSDDYMAWSGTSDLWSLRDWRSIRLGMPDHVPGVN